MTKKCLHINTWMENKIRTIIDRNNVNYNENDDEYGKNIERIKFKN